MDQNWFVLLAHVVRAFCGSRTEFVCVVVVSCWSTLWITDWIGSLCTRVVCQALVVGLSVSSLLSTTTSYTHGIHYHGLPSLRNHRRYAYHCSIRRPFICKESIRDIIESAWGCSWTLGEAVQRVGGLVSIILLLCTMFCPIFVKLLQHYGKQYRWRHCGIIVCYVCGSWKRVTLALPTSSLGASTRFRFRQTNDTSNWAVDNRTHIASLYQ